MWDEWCADDLYADAGTYPVVADNPYAFYASTNPAPNDDSGFSFDDMWGIAVTAVAGIVAYEGVRRLIARSKPKDPPTVPPSTLPARPMPSEPERAFSVTAQPTTPVVPADGRVDPAQDRVANGAELVDELIALYDLEPNDALKRRIVRSLAKVGVRIDDARAVAFDSERHDVMGTVAAEAGVAPGTVVDVVRPGFTRDDGQVIRATEVVVAADSDGAW